VTTLTDTGGDAVERYLYGPYGKVTIYDGTWTNTRSSSSYDNTILYTGREYDPETGFYNYRGRYYHAALGRFLSRDPILYRSRDFNSYRYVRNKPIILVDPTGLQAGAGTISCGQLDYAFSKCKTACGSGNKWTSFIILLSYWA